MGRHLPQNESGRAPEATKQSSLTLGQRLGNTLLRGGRFARLGAAAVLALGLADNIAAKAVTSPVSPEPRAGDSRSTHHRSFCPPGHIQLRLAEATPLTSRHATAYTLVAHACETPRPHILRNVTILEQTQTFYGPDSPGENPQREKWPVGRLEDGETVKRHFELRLPRTPETWCTGQERSCPPPPSPTGESITLEALHGNDLIGIHHQALPLAYLG